MFIHDVLSAVIGGTFGILFLTLVSFNLLIASLKHCLPVIKEIWLEYRKWQLEESQNDAEFLEVYRLYKRLGDKRHEEGK
ncbi:MAG: hypothetical protein WA705_29695 [Candidatus Ozemobacteraceae bacterium]